jgi:hypothetical protein
MVRTKSKFIVAIQALKSHKEIGFWHFIAKNNQKKPLWQLSVQRVKFIYSEKATKFCEIFTNSLTGKWHYIGQIIGGDFVKFCGLLRIWTLQTKVSKFIGATEALKSYKEIGFWQVIVKNSQKQPLWQLEVQTVRTKVSKFTGAFEALKSHKENNIVTMNRQKLSIFPSTFPLCGDY